MASIGDLTVGVKFVPDTADLIRQSRAAATTAQQALTAKLTLDVSAVSKAETVIRGLGRDLTQLTGRQASVNVNVKVNGLQNAQNDVTTLKNLLSSVGSNMQYRVTVNTTALSAVHTQIQTQITQLQSLISQLRSLGGAGGGAGGGGSAGTVNPAIRALTQELTTLQNAYRRSGDTAALQAGLAALEPRLRSAAGAAGLTAQEAKLLDQTLTRLSTTSKAVSIDQLATQARNIRVAFDQATQGVSRNSQAFRTAAADYQASSAPIVAALERIRTAGNLTEAEMRRVTNEIGQLARTQNTINGGVNHGSLSGNIANVAGQFGGSAGMAAMQGAMLVNSFRGIRESAGATGLALGGVGLAAAGAATFFVKLGSTGLDEMKKVEKGMNILQANGVRDLKAVEAQVASLQESLGEVGGAFTKGDLTLAMADIIKAGVSADDALKLMASSTRLAAAEQIGLNDASGLLLKNLRQYGLTMDDAAKTGDMLAKAGNLAAGTANDLSVGLGIVGTTGKQAKVEMHDLLAMLVTLDNVGMNAADVGANGLRAALAALSDITEKGKGVLKGLGIALEDTSGYARPAGEIIYDLAQKLQGMGVYVNKTTGELMGNGEAMKTVASIMDNRAAAAVLGLAGGWKDMGQQIKDSSGELVNYSTTMQQGVEPAVKSLQTAWKDAGAEFAKSFAGPLADFLKNTLTPTVKKLGEMFELFKDPPKFQATLKVDWANDSATMIAFKMLAGGAVAIGNSAVGKAVGNQVAGGEKTWQNMRSFFSASQLQSLLLQAGLIKPSYTPGGARSQIAEIERNMEKYRAMLDEWVATSTAAGERLNAAIKPMVVPGRTAGGGMVALNGEGPLLPGQLRATNQPFGSNFATLNPSFQKALGEVLSQYVAKNAGGLQPFINEGARTMERQAALYAQGRTTPGNIVTNAKPGQSLHNYGVAADIYWRDPKTGKVVSFTDPRALEAAKALGQLANKNGLLWGGTPGRGFPVDMPHVQYDISWQQAQREYRPATATTQGGTGGNDATNTPVPNEKLKKTLEEAHRLIKQYGMAVASGNEVWISKAENAVKTFRQANKDAWTKDLDAEFKAAGKGVAAAANVTAAQITRAMELQNKVDAAQKAAQAKPNDKGLKVAYAAATAELKKWTEASAANAAALAAVNSTQEKATRSAGQYFATGAELKKYGADALRLYKDLEKAIASGSSTQKTAAERKVAAWIGEDKARRAVYDAEVDAYKVRQSNADKATADEQTRTRNRIQTQQNLQKALAEGREADARAALDNLKRSQAAELALAQNSAAKRAEIIRQTGPAIIAAEDKIAELKRRAAVTANQKAYEDGLKLPGADPVALRATQKALNLQAYQTEREDKRKARAEQAQAERGANQAALAAQQQHERERKRLMAQAAQEARNLQNAQADATLKRIQDNNKAELDAYEGTAEEKLALIRRQSQAEFDAAELVARIRRNNALRENANKYAGKPNDPNKLAADALIRQTYTDTVTGLKNARAGVVRAAQEAVTAEAERGAAELAQAQQASYAETAQFIKDSIQAYSKEGLISLYNEARATRDQGLMAAVLTEFDRRIRQSAQEAADLWADLYDKTLQAGENPDDRSSPLDNRDASRPSRQSLAALMGNPAAFAAAWRDLGMSDTLPELVLESFTADQFADLGVPVLEGLIANLSDSPQWAKVVEVIRAGLEQAADVAGMVFQRDNELGKPLGIVTGNEKPEPDPADRTDWEKNQDAIRRQGIVESFTRMTDAELDAQAALYTLTKDTELYNAVLAEQSRRVDANKEALEGLPALLKQLELNDLNRRRDAGDVTDAAFIDERERLETELENAQWAVQQTKLTGQALENAEKEHKDRLKAIRANASKARADGLAKDVADAKDYADRYIDALKQVQRAEDDLSGAQDRPYQAQIEGLEELADTWRAEEPELAERIDHLIGKLKQLQKQAELADYFKQIAGAFGQLTGAMAEGEEDYDRLTGQKLQTPWKDVTANITGAVNAAEKLMSIATDVMKVVANPADIGAWVSLITKVVSSIADAIAGFQKAKAEVARLKADFAADNPLLNPGDYQKAYTRSRGWLADVFGGGPEVVNEIDKIGMIFAKSLQDSIVSGVKAGFTEAYQKNDFSAFKSTLKEQVFGGVISGVIDAFMNGEVMKGIVAPAIKAWSDALKTPDTADDEAALIGLDAAMERAMSAADTYYQRTAPMVERLKEKWGIGADGKAAAQGSLFGNAPTVQLGIPRLEVSLPESVAQAFNGFNAAVPVFSEASRRMLDAANLIISGQRGNSGPPPLSGLGGLT